MLLLMLWYIKVPECTFISVFFTLLFHEHIVLQILEKAKIWLWVLSSLVFFPFSLICQKPVSLVNKSIFCDIVTNNNGLHAYVTLCINIILHWQYGNTRESVRFLYMVHLVDTSFWNNHYVKPLNWLKLFWLVIKSLGLI